MAKSSKQKFYAVRAGRQGPKVYDTWDKCKENVSRYPGAKHKSFFTRAEAEAWIQEGLNDFMKRNIPKARPVPNLIPPVMENQGESHGRMSLDRPNHSKEDAFDTKDFTAFSEGPDQPTIRLSPQQKAILHSVREGNNVFYTGSAGTGKSVLLREIIRERIQARRILAITASTGIAAINIGGTTVHSWACIGLGADTAENYSRKFIYNKDFKSAKQRWRDTDVLIIDEISMIDGKLFDKLEHIARLVRGNEHPFGGIQLIISGDFAQLPPVPAKSQDATIPSLFAFEAESWDRCIGKPVTLTKVFRQKDQAFVNMLNAMRLGKLDEQMINKFQALSRSVTYTDGIEPTELYPLRGQVERANTARLNSLKGEKLTYLAQDIPGHDADGNLVTPKQMATLLDRLLAPSSLTLKVGAQVMLIKNISVTLRLVNGSVGLVTDYITIQEAESRGILTTIPEPTMRPDAQKKDNPRAHWDRTKWPVVRFAYGGSLLCVGREFTVNGPNDRVEATRTQVPLILAWALSIHKSQGQTLQRVKVDLSGIFEKGQAYVALSRATSIDTLEVIGFTPAKIQAHPRVLEWYNSLQRMLVKTKKVLKPEGDSNDAMEMSDFDSD